MEMEIIDLVKKAQAGEESAIKELMDLTKNKLFFKARAYTHNDADAQEVLQRSYIKAFGHLDQLTEPSGFENWMSTIVTNEAKNFVSEAHNRYNVNFSDMRKEDEDVVFDQKDEHLDGQPEDAYSAKEKSEIVLKILDGLPDDQRLAVMMYFYDGKTTKAIAEELGCKETTVKARIKYGKDKIKDLVLQLEKEEGLKLYGTAPLPFFIWLLHSTKAEGIVTGIPTLSNAALADAVATGTSVGAVATAGGVAAATAKVGFLSSIGGKIVLALALGAVATGGTYYVVAKNNENQPAPVVEEVAVSKTIEPVPDTEAPVIEVVTSDYYYTVGDELEDFTKGATAFDKYDDKDVPITIVGDVDGKTPGEYTLEYQAKDSAGNATVAEFVVHVSPAPTPEPTPESTPVSTSEPVAAQPQGAPNATAQAIVDKAYSLIDQPGPCALIAELCLEAAGLNGYGETLEPDGSTFYGWSPETLRNIGYWVADPLPGDLIYYENGGVGVSHISIYVGDGMGIHGNYLGVTKLAGVNLPGATAPQYYRVW